MRNVGGSYSKSTPQNTEHDHTSIETQMSTINTSISTGSQAVYCPYNHVLESEQQLLKEIQPHHFQLQAQALTEEESSNMFIQVAKAVENMKAMVPECNKWLIETLESFVQIVYWFRKCETSADYLMHISMGYKLLTGKGVTTTLWYTLDTSILQSEEDQYSSTLHNLRDLFTAGSAVIKHPLIKKIKRALTYLLVQGFLCKVGFEMSPEEFLKLEAKTKIDYNDHTSMFLHIVDTALCICERLDAYRLTGDWQSLIHDDNTYAKWLSESDRLVALAPFTSNLGPHGTTYFTFLSDLDAAIEQGAAMCKYSKANTGTESLNMRKRLNSLQMLKNVEITRKSALRERKAPLGVLIHGCSSVAKSTFSKMLFYYYGKLHGLDTDDFYRYVRSPGQDHWDNFRTSMWAIQLDDIAFILPKATAEPDPTLMEALHLIGNIAFVPPQADLADKGKTPVMSELVTATTNAADLNAMEYFHCPLAVQRRFPYVVNIVPKQEYLAENGMFINTAKLPSELTAFPDFWNITVQKFEPAEHDGRTVGTLVDVAVFSDTKKFLKHFGEFSMKHKYIQEQALSCDKQMSEFKVCPLCFQPGDECECLQGWVEYSVLRYIAVYAYVMFWDLVGTLIVNLLTLSIFTWLLKFGILRVTLAHFARFCNRGIEVRIFGFLNASRNPVLKITIKEFIKYGALFTSVYLMYRNARKCAEKLERKKETFATHDVPMDVQGNVHGTTEEQLAKEESKNVWYNPTIELHQFDVPVPSQSMSTLDAPGIRDLFSRNCVRLIIRAIDAPMAMRIGGVFLRGQYLCMNSHALREGNNFRITIVDSSVAQGLNSNIEVSVSRSDVRFIKEVDIAVVRIPDVPPRKNILKYWNDAGIPVTRGVVITRDNSGSVEYDQIFNVELKHNFPVESLGVSMSVYLGAGQVETKVGDCGSLGVAMTPRGPVILGIHTLGYRNTRGIPHVTRSQLEELCQDEYPVVEGEGEASLTLQGANTLLPPHFKSVLRYLPEGVANVYGSAPGGKPKARSRVCSTPLQKEMLEHFDCVVEHGKPCMTGWEPIYNNIKDMIKPCTTIDRSVLKECSKSFTNDIITGLTNRYGDKWKGELLTLSDRAAVNGLPGVKFIDRINVSTSMGSPWHETKKKHLVADISEEYPEGVTFSDDVWKRVHEIESLYKLGKRAFPVFTGHQKDEPKEFAKIEAKKTRLFTAAPADWSVVVRKNLLSFVRLLQKNKFIFEAGPGTVAQSQEWSDIREYLTAHGEDQIVAGDYQKYDKSMIAQLVMEAYQVIINIHRAAGFTEEECKIIACIGVDTAFPVVNLNGDILEFFGTNPSGHPLTVVINSLVNSLYVRYAYKQANPRGVVNDFKMHVNLMTYGDDNAMGISKEAGDWFNHTVIQKEMAKIGVGYTMADKGAASVPFIHIDDCSFLKRSWRYEPELDAYMCPLEEKSIHKSLTVWVPSRTIDEYAQMVAVITSANNEYFFYGREAFDKHRKFFAEVLKQQPYSLYVTDSTLPDWETLCERFRQASKNL